MAIDQPRSEAVEREQRSFLDFLIAVAAHKKLVVRVTVAVALVALIAAFTLPKWYTATTRIMPPQQTQSNAVAILGQLGALAGGATQALGLKNPSDIYVTMLKSRTIADNLIARFDLQRVYDEDLLIYARKELARNSSIVAGRDGVITIDVEDKDPDRAAALASGYVQELHELTLRLAVGEAAQRRLFFENQLKVAKNDLTNAEGEFKTFSEKVGLINPQQIGLTVTTAATLRAQIAAKEIQLAAMRTFATDENPDLKRTVQEIAALRTELGKLEKNSPINKADVMVPFGKAPEIGLEYVRKYRDMKYFETLYEALAKQYEIARIDEAKDATLIQVLDKPVRAERHSRPRRMLLASIGVLVGLALGICFALWSEFLTRIRRDPSAQQKLRALRQEISFKS